MTQYRLQFLEPWTHYLDVEMEIPVRDPGASIELWMAVWTPGSYLVREYSRNLEGFEAIGDTGPVDWKQVRKNVWTLDPGKSSHITVKYRLYCREMTVRTNWVEDDLALINGAPTYLFVRGREAEPARVVVQIPARWSGVWTGLETAAEVDTVSDDSRFHAFAFQAESHDRLIDSPLATGNPGVHSVLENPAVTLLNVGDESLWDGAAAAADVAKIVSAYGDMYGGFPFDRYLFMNYLVEGRGGLEHKDASVLMSSRYVYRDRKAYVDWLGLASHEFFHVWNVKRSRPLALGPFDYENEVYTHALWVAEGVTSYYTDLMPCRAGVTTETEFLGELSGLLTRLQNSPGRRHQSLEASSFNTWIKLYRPDENSANSSISYYLKGAVVSWLLDVEIRQATQGRKSLDDVMRTLFERHAAERGFTDAEVRAIVDETADTSMASFFKRYVEGVEELDYAPALAYLGLRFPVHAAIGAGSAPWLGVTTADAGEGLCIATVHRDGPARDAGLNVGDELLALGGYRVTGTTLEARLKQFSPGERVEVLVARRDAVRILPILLGEPPAQSWNLEVDPEAGPGALAARRAWLHQD